MASKKAFLIIEDNELDREALHRILEREMPGSKIIEAGTCAEGLSAIESNTLDCIFLDYRLPDGDGINFLQKLIRIREDCPPIIILAGLGDELLAVQAIRSGAADYIPKGLLSADLLTVSIDRALQFHEWVRRVKDAETKLAANEKKYRTIVEKISDLVFQLDSNRKFIFANKAFEMLGYDPKDLIGKPVKNLIDSENADSLLSEIATRNVGPMATNNLEVRFKINPDSSLREEFSGMTLQIDASGIWDVSDEQVFENKVDKNFLSTLCVGRITNT